MKEAIPALRKSQGRIIFTSSGAAVSTYSGWGAYGASKAALNHLAMSISIEEPSITCIAIRPGVVNTDMQKELREVHASKMSENDAAKFHGLHQTGGLLTPEQPGQVIAKLALDGQHQLSGKFLK